MCELSTPQNGAFKQDHGSGLFCLGGEFDLFKSCYNCFKNGMKMESFIIIEKD